MSSKSKKSSSTKKEKGEKRKRAPTGFFLFAKEHRADVREKLGGKDVKVTEISVELGQMWKKLTPEQKEKYTKQSRAMNEKLQKTEGTTDAPKAKKAAKKKKKNDDDDEKDEKEDEDEEEEEDD